MEQGEPQPQGVLQGPPGPGVPGPRQARLHQLRSAFLVQGRRRGCPSCCKLGEIGWSSQLNDCRCGIRPAAARDGPISTPGEPMFSPLTPRIGTWSSVYSPTSTRAPCSSGMWPGMLFSASSGHKLSRRGDITILRRLLYHSPGLARAATHVSSLLMRTTRVTVVRAMLGASD